MLECEFSYGVAFADSVGKRMPLQIFVFISIIGDVDGFTPFMTSWRK